MPLTRDLCQAKPTCNGPYRLPPGVDFRHLPRESAAIDSMRDACLGTGFFFIEHAFSDNSIVGNLLKQMDHFFSLDDQDPRKEAVRVTTTENRNGWTPMFGEPAYQPGTIAHLESFDCGRPGRRSANVWPDLANFRQDVRRCWHALSDIGDVVLESLALAAGVEPGRFRDPCNSRELSTMRLLHYPANNVPVEQKNVGIAAHTDFECITLLLQTAPGLELRDTAGNWIDAQSGAGQIVVLPGDMLECWTNGYFQAAGHRVRNSAQQRFSIVMFFAVNDDEQIGPFAEFVSADNPANYAITNQRDHLGREVQQAERYRDEGC